MNEHLLDLYLYYALIGIQSPQPSLRVAGLSILGHIASTGSVQSVAALVPAVRGFSQDGWWESRAQLLVLVSQLLLRWGRFVYLMGDYCGCGSSWS